MRRASLTFLLAAAALTATVCIDLYLSSASERSVSAIIAPQESPWVAGIVEFCLGTLAFVLVAFLDPIQAGIVLAVVLGHRGPLPVIVAGAVAALVSETVMALAADGYTWGELVAPRMVSALLQAAVLCWVVRWVRSIRAGIGAAQARPRGSAGNAGAMLGSLAGGGALPSAGQPTPACTRPHASPHEPVALEIIAAESCESR